MQYNFVQVSVDGAYFTITDQSNSISKGRALQSQDSREVPAQPVTVAPSGVPIRLIFCTAHSLWKNRWGKERISCPKPQPEATGSFLLSMFSRGSPILQQQASLAHHAWRKTDLQSRVWRKYVVFQSPDVVYAVLGSNNHGELITAFWLIIPGSYI